jgi:hypothetical protein
MLICVNFKISIENLMLEELIPGDSILFERFEGFFKKIDRGWTELFV